MTTKRSKAPKLPEFIFGALSTPEGRLQQARLARLGFYHDSTLRPPDPREAEPVTVTVRAGVDVAIKEATLYYSTDGSPLQIPPDRRSPSVFAVSMERSELTWDTLQWGYSEEWAAEIPGQPIGTHVQYAIQGITNQAEIIFSPFIDTSTAELTESREDDALRWLNRLVRENRPRVYGFVVDGLGIPAWLQEAVIYQIFAERFAPDPGSSFNSPADRSGFYGGTLRGIAANLDYLSDLGVNCLWLTPIFPSPSHHGYDPMDYGGIEPRLGTMHDFQVLVAEAHRREIRVILDFVANHCSDQHPAFVAAQQDKSNPTYEWFWFSDWPDRYESYYDVPHQPKLNGDHPEVRAYLADNAQRWLERGVDGFRLDHAHGSSHDFWSVFRVATLAVKADSCTLGEITETPSSVRSYAGRMDGCLDFRLLELLRAFFGFRSLTVSEFDKNLQQHFAFFGSGLVLPSFLDNHDMNRFLWVVDNDKRRLRLAALCQFTLPGPPIIYYGTEVGLSQLKPVGRLEEARLPMLWGDEQDRSVRAFYRELIALRRQTQAVWRLSRTALIMDDESAIYAYAKEPYTVILNNSPHARMVPLKRLRMSPGATPVLATDPDLALRRERLSLPPFAGAVIRSAVD